MVKKYIIVLLARPFLYIIYLFFYLTYFSATSPANRNVIVWGSPGTGKTIIFTYELVTRSRLSREDSGQFSLNVEVLLDEVFHSVDESGANLLDDIDREVFKQTWSQSTS